MFALNCLPPDSESATRFFPLRCRGLFWKLFPSGAGLENACSLYGSPARIDHIAFYSLVQTKGDTAQECIPFRRQFLCCFGKDLCCETRRAPHGCLNRHSHVVVVVGLLGKMTEVLMAESAMSRQPDVGAGPSARTPYFVFNCGERGCDPLAARGDQSQNAGALPTWRSLPPTPPTTHKGATGGGFAASPGGGVLTALLLRILSNITSSP